MSEPGESDSSPKRSPPSDIPDDDENYGEDDPCTCDPCECDLPGTHAAQMPPGYCTCDPCECDTPEDTPPRTGEETRSSGTDSQPRTASTISGGGAKFSVIECTCDPCECDPPGAEGKGNTVASSSGDGPSTSSNESGLPGPIIGEEPPTWKPKVMPDLGLQGQMECTCDPCLCDEPKQDAAWCEGPRRWTLPPTPEPSDHAFENLNSLRRQLCREFFPKNLGLPLTEEVVVDVLIKNPTGELELHLPGNQVYPGFLKQRICDEDIPVLVNVLLEIRGITKVNLCYNEISDHGIELLAPAIQECANIVDLNLMHNNLTAAGFLTLAKALMHRAPLQRLKMTGMKVGNEGINAITCLVLSGRVPHDLDISECDMSTEGFQALCSSLAAMDSDTDYPNYLLLKNNLPMDLVQLKEMKLSYNSEVSQVSELNRKTSLPTIVRIIDHRDHHHRHGHGPTTVSYQDEKKHGNLFEVFENFSATILQGLFDLRHRFSEDDLTAQEIKLDSSPSAIPSAAPSIMLPEVDMLVENFQKIRAGQPLNEDEDQGDLVHTNMISRSLYSLEVVDEEVLLMDPAADKLSESDESEMEATAISGIEGHHHPPDVYTAEAAATFVVKEAIQTAAKSSASSGYRDRSDITQLVLMTVLETIEKINSNTNLTEDDCHVILEDAMEKVYEFVFPRVPPTCSLSKDDVLIFFKVLFSASQGTFMKLFENPFVTQAIVEHGTKPCAEAEMERRSQRKLAGKTGAMTEEQIFQIAASFLKGVILEAARMVGVANPFGLEEDINKDLVTTELKIEGTVDSLFDTAAALAIASKGRASTLEETNVDFKKSADLFVIELFENVHRLISETQTKAATEAKEEMMGPRTYKYVSRPVRLVLNRPLFGESSPIMAAKIGDYLATNTTVTALHMQKWELGEDGLAALMDYIVNRNFTLVVLDLACNQLGADGMKLLGIYITQNKNLKHLCLGNNRIKDAGMAHINKGLPESSLVSIDITNNAITAKELDHFLTIMPLTLIRACFLWGNKFAVTTWNIMRTLLDQGILNPGYTDIVLEKADEERMIVKNMQIRDVNEYYEVPAVQDKGLRLPPVFIDESFKSPSRISSPVTSIFT